MKTLTKLERHRYFGARYFTEGLYVAAMEEACLWLASAEELSLAEEEASALNALGCIATETQEWDNAQTYFLRAITLTSDLSKKAKIYKNLGLVYLLMNQLEPARSAYEEALNYSWSVKEDAFRAQLHMDLSGILKDHDPDKAIENALLALSIFRGIPDAAMEGRTRNNLGVLYTRKGSYQEAQEQFTHAIRLLTEAKDLKNLAYTFTETARLYYHMGNLSGARKCCKKAMETIFRDVTIMDKSEVSRLRFLYAMIFEKEGNLNKAEEYIIKALIHADNHSVNEFSQGPMILERIQSKHGKTASNSSYISYEEDQQLEYLDTFLSIADSLEAKDKYTRNHSERVAGYAVRIAQDLELSEDDMGLLGRMGRVHDIGKIVISKEILNKPTHLTDYEFSIIKTHPAMGQRILITEFNVEEGTTLVRNHHERYDGTGYPDGMAGKEIPLLCRILSVADAYDAMTSHRPYRPALPHSKALMELREKAGTQFDPSIVSTFEESFNL
jgi:HD-GYP domain-containing protein (c-di-GMP phosphodiesterase class II)